MPSGHIPASSKPTSTSPDSSGAAGQPLQLWKGAPAKVPSLEINGRHIPPVQFDWWTGGVHHELSPSNPDGIVIPRVEIGKSMNVEVGSPLRPTSASIMSFKDVSSSGIPQASVGDETVCPSVRCTLTFPGRGLRLQVLPSPGTKTMTLTLIYQAKVRKALVTENASWVFTAV